MEKICPFCGKKVKALGKHLLHCKLIPNNLSNDEIKIKGLESYIYEGFVNDLCQDYNNLMSFPDIKAKYNIDYKNIYLCLKSKGIKLRTISESQKQITQNKIKNTLQKKYGKGIINVGQLESTKQKVKETSIKKWGVSNIWKTKDYAKFTAQRWKNMSIEQKEHIIMKKWISGGYISDIEIRVYNLLKQIYKLVEPQYVIEGSNHKYDIYVHDINTIFEINGDYWHLNPLQYKEDDYIQIGTCKIIAKEKWKIDKQHIKFAKQNNYIIYEIWEHDIVSKTDNELILFINNLIKNNYDQAKKIREYLSED